MAEVAFPRSAEFARTISGLRLGTAADSIGWTLTVSKECQAITSSGHVEHPQLLLSFPPDGISPEAMVKTTLRYLQKRGHAVNEQACAALLGLLSFDPALPKDPIVAANEFLEKQAEADLTQFVVLREPAPLGWNTLQMGPFSLGALDQERMRHRCEKAGSDFFRLYSKQFIHGFTIERAHRPAIVWNFEYAKSRFEKRHDASKFQDAWFSILLEYFEHLSALQFELFWEDFNREQVILAALGKHHFPDERGMSPDPWNISVYLGIGSHGYVCPTKNLSRLPWLGVDARVSAALKELREQFQFTGLTNCNPIHRTISVYAKFVKKAGSLRADSRLSEALLHYVIALDLLLGEEARSAGSVAERAAMLTHRALATDFDTCHKQLKDAYAARSKYVHEGRECSDASIHIASIACAEVTATLLRLATGIPLTEDWHNKWRLRLDRLINSHRLSEPIPNGDLEKCGIAITSPTDLNVQ